MPLPPQHIFALPLNPSAVIATSTTIRLMNVMAYYGTPAFGNLNCSGLASFDTSNRWITKDALVKTNDEEHQFNTPAVLWNQAYEPLTIM